MADKCVLCGSLGPSQSRDVYDSWTIDCAGCGTYRTTDTARAILKSNAIVGRTAVANVRGWVRANQGVEIHSETLEQLRSIGTPTVAEKAEKLIRAIHASSGGIGSTVRISSEDQTIEEWCAKCWCFNDAEVKYLAVRYLSEQKDWLTIETTGMAFIDVSIAPAGYAHLDSANANGSESDSGFCAMWFADEVVSAWREAIEPAIEDAGYRPVRIDGVQHNNKIDDEILAGIRKARFVVADFTGQRGGVYFEAGFALGLGKQVIWTVRNDTLNDVHFDNRQYNFLVWSPNDLVDFRTRLHHRIEATIGRGPV